MRKHITKYIMASLVVLSLGTSLSAYEGFVKIRPFGSLGHTGGSKVYVGDGSLMNYRFILQPMYQFSTMVSLGVDVGYLHAYTTDYTNATGTKGYSPYSRADFVHSLVLLDFSPSRENFFIMQFALGPYTGTADNAGDIHFGLMLAFGVDFPITKNISIPIVTRFDLIAADQFLAPINVSAGVTFRIR